MHRRTGFIQVILLFISKSDIKVWNDSFPHSNIETGVRLASSMKRINVIKERLDK
jgi:hypothetical protein